MDPLEILLEGLLGYFTPTFLAFTLVIGYLWFFIFYFGSKYWKSLEWPESFFLLIFHVFRGVYYHML